MFYNKMLLKTLTNTADAFKDREVAIKLIYNFIRNVRYWHTDVNFAFC